MLIQRHFIRKSCASLVLSYDSGGIPLIIRQDVILVRWVCAVLALICEDLQHVEALGNNSKSCQKVVYLDGG